MSTGWSNFFAENGGQAGDDDIPACSSCKKRKLRCSRETPTCSHCQRLGTGCVYNPKQKPGLKPGAVEALTRRVAFLERILLDDDGNTRPQYITSVDSDCQCSVKDANTEASPIVHLGQQNNADQDNFHEQQTGNPIDNESSAPAHEQTSLNPLKRKLDHVQSSHWPFWSSDVEPSHYLPDQQILCKVADFFCTSFHHWIPYINKQRLRMRVSQGTREANLDLFLHALLATTLRHMDPNTLFLDRDQVQHQIRLSRAIVETRALHDVTIESLQALVLMVFDHLNNGQFLRAWPLIGLLTRTIDYMQLATEPSPSHRGSLMKPICLVSASNDWTELEERRRLFWVIFLLDRFCSLSTGWNTSLTADDVHRRLPADGGYFTREEPVTTPYFGIWHKAAAGIGQSLAHLPAQYNEEDPAVSELPLEASSSPANGHIDASKLGAFAYCVEATESLSQVTTFFLQQRINWHDKQHAINWLTRFKELDLRLVQWKTFLPRKWADADISADHTKVDMDPNLTLAHITHNTSMILLHHAIAFPPKNWNNFVALPHICSAQTCELAAVETSNIVGKFLAHSPIPFVNAQFAFCAYVAAKALLFGYQSTRRSGLRIEFRRLVNDLWEMSDRWSGYDRAPKAAGTPLTQAAMFANHLEDLHDGCKDANFTFDLYDHSCMHPSMQQYASPTSGPTPRSRATREKSFAAHRIRNNSVTSSPSAISPGHQSYMTNHPAGQGALHAAAPGPESRMLPPSYAMQETMNAITDNGQPTCGIGTNNFITSSNQITRPQVGNVVQNQTLQDQSLITLSDTLLNSQFLDMDRVITFEDANFFMPWQ